MKRILGITQEVKIPSLFDQLLSDNLVSSKLGTILNVAVISNETSILTFGVLQLSNKCNLYPR